MFDEAEVPQVSPLVSGASAYIADTSAAAQPTERNSQLCILSSGLDLEGVAARLIDSQRQRFADRLFLVILPDGIDAGTTTEVAATLATHLRARARPPVVPAPLVHAMEEGTGVKERCLAYQQGSVVVIASRMLCADILHKRVSLIVVGLALVLIPLRLTRHGSTARRSDAITPSLAFSVELCLRSAGGNVPRPVAPPQEEEENDEEADEDTRTTTDGTNTAPATSRYASTHSPERPNQPHRAVVLLSDNPSLMQYLVQRHQIGNERFIQQMRIGDIQLFPRFRLNLVQHFEKLNREKPLHVERVVVNVATSILILDDLLQKILREVLFELHALDRRLSSDAAKPPPLARAGVPGRSGDGGLADDGVPQAFQPRARLQQETVNGKLDYSSYSSSGPSRAPTAPTAPTGNASAASAQTEGYVRRPWRAAGAASAHRILFSAVDDGALLDMESSDLDADVSAAHDAQGADWPYRTLCESLLDVRWLRRALWGGTSYDFVFALERCLERRQRRSERQPGAPPPPAALWTLSSHFHDVVTVATHRLGEVVLVDGEADQPNAHGGPGAVSMPTSMDAVVVGDGSGRSEDEEDEVAIVGSRRPPVHCIVPSSEEQDYAVEVAVRLAKSWCRDVVRKAKRAPTMADRSDPPPAFLLAVNGSRSMVRLMERLLYSAELVRDMELNSFLRRYQHHHGVSLPEDRGPSASAAPLPRTVASSNTRHTAAAPPDHGDGADLRTAVAAGGGASVPLEPTAALLQQWLDLKGDASLDGVGASSSSDDDEADEARDDAAEGKEKDLGVRPPDNAIGTTPGSARAAMQAEIGSVLFGHQKPTVQPGRPGTRTRSATATTGPTAPPAISLHQLLLSQSPRVTSPPPASNAAPAGRAGDVCGFSLERIQKGAAVLVPQLPSASESDRLDVDHLPRVVVADATQLSTVDLMAFFTGRHRCLQQSFFAAPDAATPSEKGETSASTMAEGSSEKASCRASRVQRVMVLNHSLTILRQLEMCQDDLPRAVLQALRVQLVTSTFTEASVKRALTRERQSFAALAHVKATLTGTLLMDHAALRDTEAMLENGLLFGNKRRRVSRAYVNLAGTHVRGEARVAQAPMVVFDEREFRSSLPYSLYARGLDLVPLTLTTADYILSPDYAVERKSVRDFTQSLTSGRIYHQLAALSRKYAHPLCLIEFSRSAPFRLVYASMSKTSAERGAMTLMYSRIARVVTSYPRVSWIWSRSPAHSAAMFAELKRGAALDNVDPSDPSLTSGASNWAEVGGSASPGEAASYAARVLSRFPGITPQNAPKVMQLCGSLAGLATVSKASLVTAMGDSDGEALYAFLHTPWEGAV